MIDEAMLTLMFVVMLICVTIISALELWRKHRQEEIEANKFLALSQQYSPRKVVKLKEPTKQGQEWTLEPASESMSYSVSPSVSPSPSPEIPNDGIQYVMSESFTQYGHYPTYVVASGMYMPESLRKTSIKKIEHDEDYCPFCHQKKDLTKSYCPHCGGYYG